MRLHNPRRLQVFRGVPFLYELKALLDWSVTRTTLTLVDWLKLEDIRASLYNRQCDLIMRRTARKEGSAQPATPKFLIGFSLFLVVLALLWTPLLAFSSSNPTFGIPSVTAFAFNASLNHTVPSSDGVTSMHLPIFTSSAQYSVERWQRDATINSGTMPKSLAGYVPAQLQLLCGGENSDTIWQAAPAVRRTFEDLLSREAQAGHADDRSRVSLDLGFSVLRSFPPATAYGGPECEGSVRVHLSRASVQSLADVMHGSRMWAPLTGWLDGTPEALTASMRAESTAKHSGPRSGLFAWVWQLKEHKCSVRPSLAAVAVSPAPADASRTTLDMWPTFEVCYTVCVACIYCRQHTRTNVSSATVLLACAWRTGCLLRASPMVTSFILLCQHAQNAARLLCAWIMVGVFASFVRRTDVHANSAQHCKWGAGCRTECLWW
jgi:hypothetical protein